MRREGERPEADAGPPEMTADAVGWAPLSAQGAGTDTPEVTPEVMITDGEGVLDESLSGEGVTEGETVARLEAAFPLVWGGILLLVCLIGIYSAVSNLPK